MRRMLLFCALALVLLGALPARAADPSLSDPVGLGDIYLALGDSLAVGVEAGANNDNLPGYPDYFYTLISATQPISYTNLGVSGEDSVSMLAPGGQLDDAVAFIESQIAARKVVSPVTLNIGGNDMVDVLLPGSTTTLTAALTTYRINLETILDRLIAALTVNGRRSGDLLLMNYYNPYPGLRAANPPLPLNADPDLDVPKFNQVIAEEAAERGLPFYNAYNDYLGREAELLFVRFPYDFNLLEIERNFDYHPREAGHRLMADGFLSISRTPWRRLYAPLMIR